MSTQPEGPVARILDQFETTSGQFDATARRMLAEGLKPAAERSPDFSHDDMIRYAAYAAAWSSALHQVRTIIQGEE